MRFDRNTERKPNRPKHVIALTALVFDLDQESVERLVGQEIESKSATFKHSKSVAMEGSRRECKESEIVGCFCTGILNGNTHLGSATAI